MTVKGERLAPGCGEDVSGKWERDDNVCAEWRARCEGARTHWQVRRIKIGDSGSNITVKMNSR